MTGLWRVRGDVLVGYVDECAVRDVALMRLLGAAGPSVRLCRGWPEGW